MFKKFSLTLVLVIVLAVTAVMPVYAQEPTPLTPLNPPEVVQYDGVIDETPDTYFVELVGKAVVDGGTSASLRSEKNAFRSAARRAGVSFTERRAFDTLWNGLSVKIDKSQLSALLRLPGVKAVYPVETIGIPETFDGQIDPELFTALTMTGADIAQSELHYTGAGVKVAVMDTGIDYDHPDLGGGFGPGYRVVTGWDFVGDDYDANPANPTYNPVPNPDPYPDDCNGHGTHVSGIVGANGVVDGVAPGVTFGAYRVFGCVGSTDSDIMLAAMERAFLDKMDVLNMSIGSAYNWPQYPTAVAASKMVDRGMVVVASIGNEGANGLYAAGAPGLGEKVIGVASFDNTHVALGTFSISPDNTLIGYGPATGSPLPPTSGTYPMARTGTQTSTDDGCAVLPAGSMAGKVVLIRRGTCTFYQKAFNAQTAGAIAVVLYNNTAGRFSPTVAGAPPITIPVVAISNTEGNLIDSRLAAGPVDMTWTDQLGTFLNPTGGLISSFSSYGLSPDLALKPDIGAPGGLIFSTYPLELGGYATISGTSMSSPHVAGAAALLLEAHPDLHAVEVRDVLQNSADPKNWWGNPGLGLLDNVHRQGAGMLDIDDAILATTFVTPAKIALGESEAGPYSGKLKIRNVADTPVTYDLTYVNAITSGGTITPSFFGSNAEVAFSAETVTVGANGVVNVDFVVTPATGPVNGQYGGYIVLTPQGGGQVYRVPYAGFVGDYQAIQVLAPTANGFPLLGWSPDGVNFGIGKTSFTMVGMDIPYVLAHFEHQAELLKLEIFNPDKTKNFKTFIVEEYMVRNSTSTGFFALPFDGFTFAGNKTFFVPDGDYVIKMSVLKANGKTSNPDHWEIWWSPVFTVDRP